MTAMDSTSLDRAHAEVRRRLESVGAEHWNLPTPCNGWAVMDLVRHMAVGATMSCQILAGEPWTREAVVEEVSSAPDLKAEWEWRTAEEPRRIRGSWRARTHGGAPGYGRHPLRAVPRNASRRRPSSHLGSGPGYRCR